MARIINGVYILFICFLTACQGSAPYTGVVGNLGPISAGLYVNSRGEIALDTNVSIPLVGVRNLGSISFVTGVSMVLAQAESTRNHLFLVWENEYGEIYRSEYDMGAPYEIHFTSSEWVRDITSVGDGNVVVSVIMTKTKRSAQNSLEVAVPQSDACLKAPQRRLTVGEQATICTLYENVILRESPRSSSMEIKRLIPGAEVWITDGPICDEASQYWYWKVSTQSGYKGWMAEGGDEIDTYYLCP